MWWSGDGAALLYASFNDTPVKDYSFPKYGPFEDVYTTIIDIPYPKVATRSHVTNTACHVIILICHVTIFLCHVTCL